MCQKLSLQGCRISCPFAMQGKLIAGINSKVQLYKWIQTDDGSRELQLECSHTGHVLALYIVTRGDFVIVGGWYRFILPPCKPNCLQRQSRLLELQPSSVREPRKQTLYEAAWAPCQCRL